MRKSLPLALFVMCAVVLVGSVVLLLTPTAIASAHSWMGNVVASNLDSPRGLEFGPDGSLYIAEAGLGGEGPCIETMALGTVCYGPTGGVERVLQDGTQEQYITGLPSLIVSGTTEAIGPQDIAFDAAGTPHLLIGLATDPAQRANLGEAGADFGQLGTISGGAWTPVHDVAAYEGSTNPDGGHIDTNPYSVIFDESGAVVADAGANALLRVAPDGTIITLSVFPTRTVEGPGGNPVPMQAVPTSVMPAMDGDGYDVGQLTGFPFPVGGASVFHVPANGGAPTEHHTGFTNIVSIAEGSDGLLYVLEITTNSLLSGDPTGALVRVNGDGSHTVVMSEGLEMPTSMTVGPDGALYISNRGLAPGAGEVIRVDIAPTSVTLDEMQAAGSPLILAPALLALAGLSGALFVARRRLR